jgi:hypothetical protein
MKEPTAIIGITDAVEIMDAEFGHEDGYRDLISLERRRSAARLLRRKPIDPPRDAWRNIIGVFEGDETIARIFEEARRIRKKQPQV